MNEKRRQIIEKLLEKINSGEVVTGDRLLPERQLAEAVGETRPVVNSIPKIGQPNKAPGL